ncbi:LicD family protein [Streptococcus suis]|nr:LicD family protein [Streptococcus suis]
MKQMTKDEIRKVQLDMMAYLDDFARKHHIEYSLGGGSLLGAIRHQGFIPWDDDIDIMLERSQYERLISALAQDDNPDYKLLHYSTAKDLLPFAKLYSTKTIMKSKTDKMHPWTGLFIDIFPMDRLPESAEERHRFFKEVHSSTENLLSTSFPEYASGSNALFAFARLFLRFPRFVKYHGKSKEVALETDRIMQKYNDKEVPYIGFTDSRYRLREFFPKELFTEYEDVAFEHLRVRKIKNHHAYLNQLYGASYMELPPENKRQNHDYYTWYWKES